LNSPVSEAEPEGKRVSWVELYFDLIFVLAVGQTTHIMVADPNWAGFWRAFGLFVPLWWTWIGFVVLCNRHYEECQARALSPVGLRAHPGGRLPAAPQR
jgi:low temperature requirement protein LtrA